MIMLKFQALFICLITFYTFESSSELERKNEFSRVSDGLKMDMCISYKPDFVAQNVKSLLKCIEICSKNWPHSCIRLNYRKSSSSCELYNIKRDGYSITPTKSSLDCITYLNKACPLFFNYIPDYRKCYKLEITKMNFTESIKQCNRIHERSHLVVIDDQMEISALGNYSQSSISVTQCKYPSSTVSMDVWTSGRRLQPVKNTPFVWEPFPGRLLPFGADTNWMKGEPSFGTVAECCVCLVLNVVWNDDDCAKNKCALCEVDVLH